MKKLSRRAFMKDGAKVTGGAVCALALGRGMLAPGISHASVSFPESDCGIKQKGGKRILVAYASRFGSTGGVAESIGQVFCGKGETADIRHIKNIGDLGSYDAAIIGSAVRSSKWLPEAISFIQENRSTLSRMPVAYFLTCLAMAKQAPGARDTARSYMETVLKDVPDVKPVETGFFAGVLDYQKMNFIMRAVMKSKMKDKGITAGDYRDWNRIRSWSESVASTFSAAASI
ncbi:flavodoxin domain-containing protein [Thermodesulfobacteriota bacterium]